MKSGAKRVVFVHTAVFETAKKFSLSERIFVQVRLLKAVFLQLLMVMRFDYDIALVLGLLW